MRKIKFRMWDTLEENFMNHSRVIESKVLALEYNGEGRFIFQQWTGLFDKQGKEIYEGDIIHIYDTALNVRILEMTGVVEYMECAFWIVNEKLKDAVSIFNELAELTVIGNIYQNPELLEV